MSKSKCASQSSSSEELIMTTFFLLCALGTQKKIYLTSVMFVYLNWMEDGLQHGENITEEEVPGLSQRVEQLLTCVQFHNIIRKQCTHIDFQCYSEAM